MFRLSALGTRVSFCLLSLSLLSTSCGSGSHKKGANPAPEVDGNKEKEDGKSDGQKGRDDDGSGGTQGKDNKNDNDMPPLIGPAFNLNPYSAADYARTFNALPDASLVWPEELRVFHDEARQKIASYFSEQNASGFVLRRTQLLKDFKNARVEFRNTLLRFDDLSASITSSSDTLRRDATALRTTIESYRQGQVKAIVNSGKQRLTAYENSCKASFTGIKNLLSDHKAKVLAVVFEGKSLSDADKTTIAGKFDGLGQLFDQMQATHCEKDLSRFYPEMEEKLAALGAMLSDSEGSNWSSFVSNLEASARVIEAKRKKMVEQATTLTARLPQYQDLELSGADSAKLIQTMMLRSLHESLNSWYWTRLCLSPLAMPTEVSAERVCGLSKTPVSADIRAARLTAFKDRIKDLPLDEIVDTMVARLQSLPTRDYMATSVAPFKSGVASLVVDGPYYNTGIENLKDTLKTIKADTSSYPSYTDRNTYLFDSLYYLKSDTSAYPSFNDRNAYLFDSTYYLKSDTSAYPSFNDRNSYLFDALYYLKSDTSAYPSFNDRNSFLFDALYYLKSDTSTYPSFNDRNSYLFDCAGYTLDTTSSRTMLANCLKITDKVGEIATKVAGNLRATESAVATATQKLPGLAGLAKLWETKMTEAQKRASDFVQSAKVQRYGYEAPRNLAITGEALVAPLWQGEEPNPQNLVVDRIEAEMLFSFKGLYQ